MHGRDGQNARFTTVLAARAVVVELVVAVANVDVVVAIVAEVAVLAKVLGMVAVLVAVLPTKAVTVVQVLARNLVACCGSCFVYVMFASCGGRLRCSRMRKRKV